MISTPGLHSISPHTEPRLPFQDRKRAALGQHNPRQNRLLAALPPDDYRRLLPDLEPVPLPKDWTVHEHGDREDWLYFLTAGIVSRFHETASGASVAFSVTGSEGVIGVASFLGGGSTRSRAQVLSAGHAFRLKPAALNMAIGHGGPLLDLLLRYTHALVTQIALTAACMRHHSLEQQLCRLILSSLDRLPEGELTMTQELASDMLGVRREGVTEAAGKLQAAGLIQYGRGHIAVLARPKLEKRACECYSVIKREFERLFPISGSQRPLREGALAVIHA